jgi:hypothetical protein
MMEIKKKRRDKRRTENSNEGIRMSLVQREGSSNREQRMLVGKVANLAQERQRCIGIYRRGMVEQKDYPEEQKFWPETWFLEHMDHLGAEWTTLSDCKESSMREKGSLGGDRRALCRTQRNFLDARMMMDRAGSTSRVVSRKFGMLDRINVREGRRVKGEAISIARRGLHRFNEVDAPKTVEERLALNRELEEFSVRVTSFRSSSGDSKMKKPLKDRWARTMVESVGVRPKLMQLSIHWNSGYKQWLDLEAKYLVKHPQLRNAYQLGTSEKEELRGYNLYTSHWVCPRSARKKKWYQWY